LIGDVHTCSVHRSEMTGSFMKIRDMISMPRPPDSRDRARASSTDLRQSKKGLSMPAFLMTRSIPS
jgi:hypothetical protein